MWGFEALVTIVMIVIERVRRGKFRLMHALILFLNISLVFNNVIHHLYWNKISCVGYSDPTLSKTVKCY